MLRLEKIRPKDWLWLLFAAVSISAIFYGLHRVFGELLIPAIGCAVWAIWLLRRRRYKYFWRVVVGRKSKGVNWGNYYEE